MATALPQPVHRIALLLLLALLGPLMIGPPVLLADDVEDEAALMQAARERRTRQANQAQKLPAALGLSEAQARQLLEISQKAATIQLELAENEAALLPEMIEAFEAFAQEDAMNQGFSPEVEKRTAGIHHEAKELRETVMASLLDLEERAIAILTPAQKQAVEDRQSQKGPKRQRGAADGKHHRGKAHRERANRGSANPADDRLRQARDELQELQRELHPHLSQLGELLLHPVTAETLCQAMGTRPTDAIRRAAEIARAGSDPETDRQLARVKALRTEINNWNLINGLHLGTDQIERIVAMYDAFEAKADALKQKTQTERPRGKGRHNRRGQREQRHNPRAELFEKRLALEHAVDRVLSPGQKQVLADYKACLLPPKDLKNPVRAGQANDHSAHEQWLTKARKAGPKRLGRMIQTGLEKEAEHFGPLDEAERRERIALLRAVVKEAAAMSDTDFELNKAELAERIAPRDRADELKKEIQLISRKRGLPGPIAQFILQRPFIEQLRQRGQQLARGTANVEQTDRSEHDR